MIGKLSLLRGLNRTIGTRICACGQRRNFSGEIEETFDLVVIGGGSGGLACAKQAASLGARACVLDYVAPSPAGTKWGLGGTCVNVGCIPKKLYHRAAILNEGFHEAPAYGFDVPGKVALDWPTLMGNILSHTKSLNWGHRVSLKDKKVRYYNAFGSFVTPDVIKMKSPKGEESFLKAKNVVIAVGGRPVYPDVEGAKENCITSDDVFTLKSPPGKSLIVGGSYVALETAGFLRGLGFDVTVMLRSIPLRGFDREIAKLIVQNMEARGVKFLRRCLPSGFRKDDGNVKVTWKDKDGASHSEAFKTVMLAVGRRPVTDALNLSNAGVEVNTENGKLVGHDGESTNVKGIYAIGDVLDGRQELTPVAAQAGRLLADRVFGKDPSAKMDYSAVPTTVFTPLEYGCVGMSEEEAFGKFGEDNIEVYHAFYKPLEFYLPKIDAKQCYLKIITGREKPGKVLGLHFLGPNAGEVVQGFGVAMKAGLTKAILDRSVGIHPTNAEELVKPLVTKRSGADPAVGAC